LNAASPANGDARRITVAANGLDFAVDTMGEGDHLALCLHGFPELAHSWRFQLPLLARKGYRVWAPDLRCYGDTTRPGGVAAYRPATLLADVAALIDASGCARVTLIAHDWGGLIAWHFAIQRIRPLERLVVMNLPHPECWRASLRHWPQRLRSWYIAFFQLPFLPERYLGRGGGEAIRRIFADMAVDRTNFDTRTLDIYADAACRPGALTAMVNYYRALLRFRRDLPRGTEPGAGKVEVPTLIIWGEQDSALGLETLDGTERYVADLTIERLPGVSHWVQQEAPERVNAILDRWLPDHRTNEE